MDMSCLMSALPPVGAMPQSWCPPPPLPQQHQPQQQQQFVDEQYLSQQRLLELIKATGFQIEQFNGQRCTGPPADWTGPPPGQGCEVFIGKVPRDLYEDELVPLLQKHGRLYELRLMMDFSGTNRGFGFAQFSTPEEAERAVKALDGHPVRPGKHLGVMMSLDNRRLFVGGLPKTRTKEEIWEQLSKLVDGIVDVILYSSVVDKSKNRGFAFVEFQSHRVAAIARRKLIPEGVTIWDHTLAVDWAEPEPEVPRDVMAKVKVLYMRNLELQTTECCIRDVIEKHAQIPRSAIERVKKLKDFAFLHFTDRSYAEQALPRLNNLVIDGSTVIVLWAKPPQDNLKCKKMKSLPADNSLSDDDSPPKGRPILGSRPPVSSPLHGARAPISPYKFWNALVSICCPEEPLATIATLQSQSNKHQGPLFMATVKVPYGVFQGDCAGTPELALESAAEKIYNWIYHNAPQVLAQSPPPSYYLQQPGMMLDNARCCV